MINKHEEVKDRILSAVSKIADPVRQTIGPNGRNVLFQDEAGNVVLSNDGVTIAKTIHSEDPVEDMIISVIRGSALKTNSEAGDGTSTSILLAQTLINEGLDLVEQGYNPMQLKEHFEYFGNFLKGMINDMAIKVKSDKDLFKVAVVAANNDESIAKDVVDTVKITGEDGMVFLEPNNKLETELEEDTGFFLKQGMFSPELRSAENTFSASYRDVPVILLDKNIYHQEEAESILRPAIIAKVPAIVVIAKDFSGRAINVFLANHMAGKIKVLLVKDEKEQMSDLAVYLNTNIVTEKSGSIVGNITMDNFQVAERVFSDPIKTLITPILDNPMTESLVKELKKELAKDKDNEELKERISSLTNGMVTIKVGGSTPIEIRERMYRYEDAVNATKSAMKYGYLVGGGLSLLRAWENKKGSLWERIKEFFATLFNKTTLAKTYALFCSASVRQLAENNGIKVNTMLKKIEGSDESWFGYNAKKNLYEDLLKAGIIDPVKVTELAIDNSISIANAVLTAGYLITK